VQGNRVDRRSVLKAMSAAAAVGVVAAQPQRAAAQQVKWSAGTEAPKLRAPAGAADCHHHIYDAKYPADPRSTLRPGDASVEDYRTLQRRIGTSRNVIVQPSTYGTDNSCTLDALVAFGPTARAVAVVDTTVSDAELKRMNGLGVRGIRFNLAQAGATTPEMIEPLSKRVNELGWHIQINAPAAKIMEIKDILNRVPSPIVFDHLAHIPEPEGTAHPLFGVVLALIERARPGSSCRAPMPTPRSARRAIRIPARSRAPMCRRRPSAWCGAATGRIRRNEKTSRTTPSCSTSSSTGPPRSASETAFWCKTRKCSTASRRAREQRTSPSGLGLRRA